MTKLVLVAILVFFMTGQIPTTQPFPPGGNAGAADNSALLSQCRPLRNPMQRCRFLRCAASRSR